MLGPRERRALEALLAGPLSREELDKVAGASNGPALIHRLRGRGLDFDLPCDKLPTLDRDGAAVYRGEYCLSPADRVRAAALLRGEPAPAELPGQLALPGLPSESEGAA